MWQFIRGIFAASRRTRPLRNCLPEAIAVMLAFATTGCTGLRPFENFTLAHGERDVVWASGYAPRGDAEDAVSYNRLDIDLRQAPPFIITLPDGYRANSTMIDAKLLADHGISELPAESERRAIWKDTSAWFVGRHLYYDFRIADSGGAEMLRLGACGHRVPAVLGMADATVFFDFPIKRTEVEKLFQSRGRTDRVDMLIGIDCF
jgi:hypothetical protein